MSKICPHCGQEMTQKTYKVTAGYYTKLADYIVEAYCVKEAEDQIRYLVQKFIHPEADVVGTKEI